MNRILACTTCILLFLCISAPSFAQIDDICTKMDDPKFKGFCLNNFDTNKDGILSQEEAEAVTEMGFLYASGIRSLKGIEYFTNLTLLNCSLNELTKLDVSKNTALKELRCNDNLLTMLIAH